MFPYIISTTFLTVTSILISSIISDARVIRETPSSVLVKSPVYLDKWNFTAEFNSLCAGIYPDDETTSVPVLRELSVESTKLYDILQKEEEELNEGKFVIQARSINEELETELESSELFVVSCLYQHLDGEKQQLGSYIAEQIGSTTINV